VKTTMLLRVIITPECINKLTLPKVPSSVDELKEILCDKLKIDQNFVIQYEDPDFGGQLCNLSNIEELPSDKVTLKIIWEMCKTASEAEPPRSEITGSDTDFPLDTASISSSLSSESSSTVREECWPRIFLIPNFSYDVEFRLRKANEVYEKQKTTMDVTRDIKTEILEKLAETMYSFKAYPGDSEIDQVAVALVSRHPCLRELGCDTGCKGWKMSLKFKMGNYRQKLRNAGCSELGNKRDDGSRVPQKKPRRSVINFLPDNPVGLDDAALEHEREQLELEPLVSVIKERWPGLFLKDQVCAEFQRITCVDLKTAFMTALNKHSNALIKMYRAKSKDLGDEMKIILDHFDEQDTDLEETYTRGVKLGILEVMEDDLSQATKRCLNFSIILEETVVMEDLSDFPTAFIVLFGLLYALNIEYPKGLKYTFEAVQNIFVGLGEKCTNRAQSLKNKLFTV
uniref:PB1 domain-containing protein n=1 Tax=Sinocyclocheilus anshuiensis TaxID=1608454 RepID=A0A671PIJ6_9TELE